MNLLVLGGTIFLGRHIVEAAVTRGHAVTLFNRGRHNPQLFPDVEKLQGDRNDDLAALRGRRFDTTIDTSGYRPEQMRTAAETVRDTIAHYMFISTISVYRAFPPDTAFDEFAPTADGTQGYGPLKARCEEVLESILPARVAHVRPGLIVGPHDPTERFTYWTRRVARGGAILAPGRPERPVQFVDVRDLAEWCVRLAEIRCAGVFNAVGPAATMTMMQLLQDCRTAVNSNARFVWIPDETLISGGVVPWTELPLWIPERDPHAGGMLLADNSRAVAAGLTFRPTIQTILATLEWDHRHGSDSADGSLRVSPINATREAELLAVHTRTSSQNSN
jgi:2'-hydroxyisoflavone reductase